MTLKYSFTESEVVDLDEAKFYGSYPLLADSDRDGASDADEIAAGTHPANPGSIFAVKIDTDKDGKTKHAGRTEGTLFLCHYVWTVVPYPNQRKTALIY